MNRSSKERARRNVAAVGLTALVVGPGMAAPGAAQAPEAGAYTAAQAVSGRAIYERECAVCHQTNLQGSFEAPQLAGESFLRFWADLSPGDLFVRVSGSMPPGEEGSLTDEEYVDVVAYLLEANGAPAGATALAATADVPIGTLAGGASPAGPRRGRRCDGLGLRGGWRGAAGFPDRGGGRARGAGERRRHPRRHGRGLPAGHRRDAAGPRRGRTG